ncbi:DUF1254 domain-containing protein [Parvularcula sp. IMCC14364]|uniref:DUF1254 domain-containing protein n=1 Tax=Parvularcula sp. IMCC14364 TaxID=3067902 RepID=UPI0027425880|nr:DUF1254 domain-containing protein [Parvularcula sp. IMCC14364]
MIRIILWLTGIAIIAYGTVQIAARQIPNIIMTRAIETLQQGYDTGYNTFAHSGPITAQNQRIVRPSPDLAYSICLYDVSDGAVAVTVPEAANYLSVALYDMNTDNFFHLNDSEMTGNKTKIIILPPQKDHSPMAVPGYSADRYIAAPTKTGLVLVRRVLMDEQDWPVIEEERRQMTCETVTPG